MKSRSSCHSPSRPRHGQRIHKCERWKNFEVCRLLLWFKETCFFKKRRKERKKCYFQTLGYQTEGKAYGRGGREGPRPTQQACGSTRKRGSCYRTGQGEARGCLRSHSRLLEPLEHGPRTRLSCYQSPLFLPPSPSLVSAGKAEQLERTGCGCR